MHRGISGFNSHNLLVITIRDNMNEKDLKLFMDIIHEIKYLIGDITKERKEYHETLSKLRKEHDKRINKMIKRGLKAIEELYELFDDLEKGEK